MTALSQHKAPLFILPHPKDEIWRYGDHGALKAAQAWDADVPPAQNLELQDGARHEVVLLAGAETASHPFTNITVDKGAKAVLIHRFEGDGWLNARMKVNLDGADLVHIILQDRKLDAVTTAQIDVKLREGARYDLHILQTGSKYGRIGVHTDVVGEGAHFGLHAAQLSESGQTIEIATTTTHAVPHTTSNQVIRNVLRGKAVTNYLGKIKVERGAQKTDAEQNARSLILDRTATANTKPELEIYADDVKCAHGAAIGELDEKALFYLMARGINRADAKALLIEAFVADVLGDIPDEAARDAVMARASAWMEGSE